MASTDATAIPVKNQAYRVTLPIWDADGDLVTGATGLDSEVSKDGGTFTDCTNEATEIATSSGMYFLDLTSTEMNADTVAIIVKTSSSGAKTTPIILYPQEAGDIKVNATYWNGTAVSSPATAGIPDVNVKNMNNVAATSITTVNANVGTTQPVNYTGTGASALVKSDMVDVAGAAVSTSTAQLGVNAVNVGGTAQTGRDIGASVLISAGTGTGQLDVTSGVIKANLAQILGTALTETAGLIAAGFKQFFNISGPTSTMNTITNLTNAPTAGDLTATMKTSVTTAATAATPVAASVTGAVGSIATGGIAAASFAAGAIDAAAIATDAIGSAEISAAAVTKIQAGLSTYAGGAVASVTGNVGGNVVGSVGSLTTNNDKTGYALSGAGVTAVQSGLSTLTAAQVNTEADTALSDVGVTTTITGRIDAAITTRLATAGYTAPDNTSVTAIKAQTDLIPATPAAVGSAMTLSNAGIDAIFDRADGVETGYTVRQVLRLLAAAMAGELSGAATTTITIRNITDTKARITATVDSDGNRTAVTTDVS
jgi:hypothetical protein